MTGHDFTMSTGLIVISGINWPQLNIGLPHTSFACSCHAWQAGWQPQSHFGEFCRDTYHYLYIFNEIQCNINSITILKNNFKSSFFKYLIHYKMIPNGLKLYISNKKTLWYKKI